MPKHSDFETIYQNFVRQYGQEQGEQYYYAWLNKNELDDSKPYNVEEQYFRESLKESFGWASPAIRFVKEDSEAKYYKVRALTANMSMNLNDYRDVEKMMVAARSLSWRPLNMNHDHNQWLSFPDARVHFATFEDNAVECLIRVPNYMADVQHKIDMGLINHVSIEGFPLEGYGKEGWEGFDPEEYAFTGLALLEKGVQLPGDPLTTIDPLTESVQHWMTPINESLGHSLIESLKRRKKMKEQEQTTVEPTEWTDEDRAKQHYGLTDEQWSLLTPEERQDLISKLPRKTEETPASTAGVVEQAEPEKDEHGCIVGKEKWNGEACVVTEQLDEPLEVTVPEEQSVETGELPPEIPDCDPGTHWDPEQMACVPDDIPTGETAGADASTPGPEQTMPLATEKREAIITVVESMVEQEDAEYWGGRGPGFDNCVAYFTSDEGWTEEDAKLACTEIAGQNGTIPEMLLRGQAEEEHGCGENEVYSKELGKCVARTEVSEKLREQDEEEKDEHGCVVGKEKWDGNQCVAVEPETSEKLKEQGEPVELEVQGEEIATEPSHVPPAECEVGTHRDSETGLCVPDEPTEPEDALDVTVPEEETTLEKYLNENIRLKRIQAENIIETRQLKHEGMVQQQEITRHKRKLAEAKGRIAELEKEQLQNLDVIAQRDETIQELEQKRGYSSGRLTSLTRQNSKLTRQNNELKSSLEKVHTRLADLKESHSGNLNELNKTSTRLLGVEGKNKKLQENHVALQKEIAQLTAENAKSTRETADLSEKLASCARKSYTFEKANIELNKRVRELIEKLKKANKFAKKIIVKV